MTLMLRAYHHWDFPKEFLEDDEEPLDAAKREVKEETSVDDLSFDRACAETGPYGQGEVARHFDTEHAAGRRQDGYLARDRRTRAS